LEEVEEEGERSLTISTLQPKLLASKFLVRSSPSDRKVICHQLLDADAIIFVYDITDKKSFDDID
jgi:GTPase SAR1 family protein